MTKPALLALQGTYTHYTNRPTTRFNFNSLATIWTAHHTGGCLSSMPLSVTKVMPALPLIKCVQLGMWHRHGMNKDRFSAHTSASIDPEMVSMLFPCHQRKLKASTCVKSIQSKHNPNLHLNLTQHFIADFIKVLKCQATAIWIRHTHAPGTVGLPSCEPKCWVENVFNNTCSVWK